MNNALNWFEIPATDIDRAAAFYETLLGRSLRRETMGDMKMGVFAHAEQSGVGGCVIAGENCVPAAAGTVVYLDATPSIDAALRRTEKAGGRIALGKTALPPGMGYFAQILDSEGNRVGLHSQE